MRQSVRRTITLRPKTFPYFTMYATTRGREDDVRADWVQKNFGPQPDRYSVRYYLNPKGYLTVQNVGYSDGTAYISVMGERRGQKVRMPVCFLPSEWIGSRVSRKAWRA